MIPSSNKWGSHDATISVQCLSLPEYPKKGIKTHGLSRPADTISNLIVNFNSFWSRETLTVLANFREAKREGKNQYDVWYGG